MATTKTERRLAITPGQLVHDEDGATIELPESHERNDYNFVVADFFDPTGGGCANDNARLFLDAHNTANACDMLPSELLAKLTKCAWELEKARQELVSCKAYLPPMSMEIVDDRITRIELFISTLNLPK